MACTPDELTQLPVSVVVCTAWLPRCCVHGVCGSAQVVGLGPNVTWLSAGRGKVRRKDSGGKPYTTGGYPTPWVSLAFSYATSNPHPCAEPFEDANKRPTSLVAGEA